MFPMHATYSNVIILLDLINLVTGGENTNYLAAIYLFIYLFIHNFVFFSITQQLL